ncbi:MAG: hypothetical protein FH748_10590 [Balneolaceae bacterium]|nr:hypothetical protein [Balneolaceae bacterium]
MRFTYIQSFLFLLLIGVMLDTNVSYAQQIPANIADKIEFRDIGPTRQGGRYVDFAVVEKSPKVFYTATASGGLWKTLNNGISYFSIFDNESVVSIGDVTVDQRDTSIVWVGTGEANNSRSSYFGDGVYKSTDGGKTWKNMGLPESHHIGRILIDPDDSDIVYVAALGHLYSDNPERGLYKTTDGGKSWNKVLEVESNGKKIGVVDVAMHPTNSDILLAATYDKIRKPWTFNPGGPGSAIYKSTDAGKSWTKLENGLPGGFLGRIGVDFSKKDPNIIYANIENVNVEGIDYEERLRMLTVGIPLEEGQSTKGVEVYRSDDTGQSWRKVSPDGEDVGGGPGYYYQQMEIDPNNSDHVYVLGIRMWETVDGGKTWKRPFRFGGDNHAMWIDPADSKHMLLGYDHGMGITYDGGKSWYHPDEIPLAQFYSVGVDMAYPYNVYGGLQDNGSVKGPSSKPNGAPIQLEDWTRTGGGDGMYNIVDYTNNRYLYNESQFGPIQRVDLATGERKSIRYEKAREMRWNWSSPIIVSEHNADVIYHAGNKVLRSDFRGEDWEEISPDLSNNDSVKAAGTGNIQYGTITTLEESPINPDELWAGTDDGNVQLTTDGGENWTKLNDRIKGNPGYWVSRIEASAHHPGTAYVTYTGLRRDDFRPFVYKTTDFGKTWTSIAANLPDENINVIKEDHKNPKLLFIGTDQSVFTSIDGGKNWTELTNGYPTNPAYDLVIHPRENDIVVGTHGRGIFIADISPLQKLSSTVLDKKVHLFDIEDKVKWGSYINNNSSYINFNGESEAPGTHIYFYAQQAGDAAIHIYKGKRKLRTLDIEAEAGLNHTIWNMDQIVRERTEEEMEQVKQRAERMKEWGYSEEQANAYVERARFITADVQEGKYRLILEMNGQKTEKEATVLKDLWYNK